MKRNIFYFGVCFFITAALTLSHQTKPAVNILSPDAFSVEASEITAFNKVDKTVNEKVDKQETEPASQPKNKTPNQSPSAPVQKSLSRGGSTNQNVNVKPVTSSNVELLDWWKSARFVFSVNSIAKVTDLYTGKTFNIKRTMGTNHADCEALTKQDSEIIKSIWGGFSWTRRPVIVAINGRRLAASMSGMPHAGLDAYPAYQTVNNRSDGYGTGQNLDVIKGNGMDGHFDVHFLNSTRHLDGKLDPAHQKNVMIAAGK